MLNIYRILILIFSFTLLTSCQHKFKKPKDDVSADSSYRNGITSLEKNDYKKAATYLTQVFFLDPSSPLAEKAQVLESYAYFMSKQYEEAIEVAENFLRFYPASIYSDYVSYLNALSHYVQINPTYLDQSFTYKTKSLFKDFIKNYPNSPFEKFAEQKLLVINNNLAAKEMDIGRYYMFLNDPAAGIVRFKIVLSEYAQTNQVPEALYRLSASFMMLGIEYEAKNYVAILGNKFPDSKWYNYAYNVINSQKLLQKAAK
jgi:outer membrane protein assembly factor BamD